MEWGPGAGPHGRPFSGRRGEWAILSLCGFIGSPPCVRPHRDCHVAPLLIMTAIIPSPLMGEGWGRVKIPAKCHCEERPLILSSSKDVAIPLAQQQRFADVCSASSRLPRRCAPRNDRIGLMRTHFVIASVAWQSPRRSNGGSAACVQPHRDCHVPRRARDERALLAMTD